MTAYANFVQDFPKRCLEILSGYESTARMTNREVTLTLAIASSAFVVPFERLNPSNPDHVADDRWQSCVKKMGQLMNRAFLSWAPGKSWAFASSVPGSLIRAKHVEEWLGAHTPSPIDAGRNVGTVLTHIRNALAHGNIFTYPSGPKPEPIAELLFLSKRRHPSTGDLLDEYNVLQSTPEDFLWLVKEWIHFLEGLPIPREPTQVSFIELPVYQQIHD